MFKEMTQAYADFCKSAEEFIDKQKAKSKITKRKDIDKMVEIKTWEDLMMYLDKNLSSLSISVEMKGEYGETSLSFYKDGTVWAGGNHGSVRIFKHCPYQIMAAMFLQKTKENLL